jgi:hypothetical protein
MEAPREARYAHQFSFYNAINFQITLGAPMIIYAKSLGASSTTIGIVAALAPLLTVLQLPTAYFIPRIGYKRFVLLGWFSRTLVGFGLALVPVATFFDQNGPHAHVSVHLQRAARRLDWRVVALAYFVSAGTGSRQVFAA